MRKWIVLAAVLGLVAVPLVVLASTGRGTTPVKCISSQWRTDPVSTSSTHWATVPRFRVTIGQIRPVVINVSALMSAVYPARTRVSIQYPPTQATATEPLGTHFRSNARGSYRRSVNMI